MRRSSHEMQSMPDAFASLHGRDLDREVLLVMEKLGIPDSAKSNILKTFDAEQKRAILRQYVQTQQAARGEPVSLSANAASSPTSQRKPSAPRITSNVDSVYASPGPSSGYQGPTTAMSMPSALQRPEEPFMASGSAHRRPSADAGQPHTRTLPPPTPQSESSKDKKKTSLGNIFAPRWSKTSATPSSGSLSSSKGMVIPPRVDSVTRGGSNLALQPSESSSRPSEPPEHFISKLTDRSMPLKTLYRTLTGLREALSSGSKTYCLSFLQPHITPYSERPIRGIDALQITLERIMEFQIQRSQHKRLMSNPSLSSLNNLEPSPFDPAANYSSRNHNKVSYQTSGKSNALTMPSYADAIPEDEVRLEVIRCIKALLRSLPGASAIMDAKDLLHHVAYCLILHDNTELDFTDVSGEARWRAASLKLRGLVAEVMGALCLISPDGHRLVLDTLARFPKQRQRFERLLGSIFNPFPETSMDALSDASPSRYVRYRTSMVILVNAIISAPERLEDRMALRLEMENTGFVSILRRLNDEHPSAALKAQLEVYMDEKAEDTKLREASLKQKNLKASDPSDMLRKMLDSTKSMNNPEFATRVVTKTLQSLTNLATSSTTDEFARAMATIMYISEGCANGQGRVNSTDDFVRVIDAAVQRSIGVRPFVKAHPSVLYEHVGDGQSRENMPNLVTLIKELDDLRTAHKALQSELDSQRKETSILREALARTNRIDKNVPPALSTSPSRTSYDRNESPFYKQSAAIGQLWEELRRLESMLEEHQMDSKSLTGEELKKFFDLLKSIKNGTRGETTTAGPTSLPTSPTAKPVEDAAAAGAPPPPPPPPPGMGAPPPPPPPPMAGGPPPPPPPPGLPGGPPPPPPPGPMGGAGLVAAPALPPIPKSRPATPLKPLNWTKLPNHKITNTLWNNAAKDVYGSKENLDLLTENGAFETDLVELFPKQKEVDTAKKSDGATDKPAKEGPKILIELNRSRNMAIMLGGLRMDNHTIRMSILTMDETVLSLENLKGLRQHAPTAEEISLVRAYDGDVELLGQAERYILEIMSIPRLPTRLDCMIYARRFKYEVDELLPDLTIVRTAISQVLASDRLQFILKTILVMGNYMNGTSFRGNAYGFHIDALLKLKETKAINPKASTAPTLLHYLVRHLEKIDPNALDFWSDIQMSELASKVSIPALIEGAKALRVGMDKVKAEIKAYSKIPEATDTRDTFFQTMSDFAEANEKTVAQIEDVAAVTEKEMRELLQWVGEDPDDRAGAPEFLFDIFYNFHLLFERARKENAELDRKKAREKELEMAREASLKAASSRAESPVQPSIVEAPPSEAAPSLSEQDPREQATPSPSPSVAVDTLRTRVNSFVAKETDFGSASEAFAADAGPQATTLLMAPPPSDGMSILKPTSKRNNRMSMRLQKADVALDLLREKEDTAEGDDDASFVVDDTDRDRAPSLSQEPSGGNYPLTSLAEFHDAMEGASEEVIVRDREGSSSNESTWSVGDYAQP